MTDALDALRSRVPDGLPNAVYQWVVSRRGRVVIGTFALLLTIMGLLSHTSSESLSSYSGLSNYAGWWSSTDTHSAKSPLLTPSKTVLQLEAGNLTAVPNHLKKGNPSFHVLIPNPEKDAYFCKSVLSQMILNYPPPTIVNGFESYGSEMQKEMAKIRGTYEYLQHKSIKDDDLVMIVDGNAVWFQLPPDVIIRQYEALLHNANARLKKKYGSDKKGHARYRQTTIWGAAKNCDNLLANEPACQAVPDSPLRTDNFGPKTDLDPEGLLHRPKYLNAQAGIGPAKYLRPIFERAFDIISAYHRVHKGSEDRKIFTANMALASVFGEQEYGRELAYSNEGDTTWHNWLSNKLGHDQHSHDDLKSNGTSHTIEVDHRFDYSMGLDYSSTLFQATAPSAPNELSIIRYDMNPSLAPPFPEALAYAQRPFLGFEPVNELSPNKDHTPYVPELRFDGQLDLLPHESTTYVNLTLIVNANNPSLPAALVVPPEGPETTKKLGSKLKKHRAARLDIWESLWYTKITRAMLRHYLRSQPQGVLPFHNAAVGGDRGWDMRGGAGGVWDSAGHWMEWGKDVCADESVQIFDDGFGKFFKEHEPKKDEDKKDKRSIIEDSPSLRQRFAYSEDDMVLR